MKLIEIQRSLKEKYGFHIVCIQSGKFYVFLNEDATLISDRFDFKLYGKEVLMTGFPVWFQIEKFVDFCVTLYMLKLVVKCKHLVRILYNIVLCCLKLCIVLAFFPSYIEPCSCLA